MIIINSNNTPTFSKKNCIALGNFDGVHIGHQSIIRKTVDYALNNKYNSCVYTFDIPPSHVLGMPKTLLCDNREKCRIFEELGCDIAYFENFSAVRSYTPADFCKKIIAEKLNAAAVFCGENYKFGKNGEGTVTELAYELSKFGISVYVLPYKYYGGEIVSSTEIRNSLICGKADKAAEMLGRPYSISGTVLHGKQLGRKLGFPTLNIEIPTGMTVPLYGVYFSTCELSEKTYRAISNIGIRPTTDDITHSKVNCETFLFDFDGDAYGYEIKVNLYRMHRCEMTFASVLELKAQVDKDIASASEFFEKTQNGVFYNA